MVSEMTAIESLQSLTPHKISPNSTRNLTKFTRLPFFHDRPRSIPLKSSHPIRNSRSISLVAFYNQSNISINSDFDIWGGFLKNQRHRDRRIRSNGSREQDGDSMADKGDGGENKNASKSATPPPAPSAGEGRGLVEEAEMAVSTDNSGTGDWRPAPAARDSLYPQSFENGSGNR